MTVITIKRRCGDRRPCLGFYSIQRSRGHIMLSAQNLIQNRPLILRGPVTKVEWVNPHAWIHMEHTNEAGEKEQWMVEGGYAKHFAAQRSEPAFFDAWFGFIL